VWKSPKPNSIQDPTTRLSSFPFPERRYLRMQADVGLRSPAAVPTAPAATTDSSCSMFAEFVVSELCGLNDATG